MHMILRMLAALLLTFLLLGAGNKPNVQWISNTSISTTNYSQVISNYYNLLVLRGYEPNLVDSQRYSTTYEFKKGAELVTVLFLDTTKETMVKFSW